jgi:aspartyl-tRNA(Asn)/glutamyl-tRNA(Gln) amidotransferase subunit B
MKNYLPVIGLEVHVELNTKTKMFCSCSAEYFGAEPNSHTCSVCLGLPGALPYINKEAIKKCLMVGLSLNCIPSERSLFERKNYFYPDLSKGYQISQYRWPLTTNGTLDINGQTIRINRVHQEEDTGKLMHQGQNSVVDFNRSGVPLVEIVTEPDFTDSLQVREFAKKLQQLFRTLGVSNADMERGDMRLEANVSVRPEGQTELPNYRIELKNINSFKFMGDAIEYEINRQIEELEKGTVLTQETRGWDENKKETFLQRSKEEANDYRYFPEPDLPELEISTKEIDLIKIEMPELPWVAEERLLKLGLSTNEAKLIGEDHDLLAYFELAAEEAITNQLPVKLVASTIVNSKIDTKSVSPVQLVHDLVTKKQSVITDDSQIRTWVEEVIDENSGMVEQYKFGKVTVIQALIGQVMRKSQGKSDAGVVKTILEELLANS